MSYYQEFTIFILFQLLPLVAGIWRWKIIDSPSKVITVIAGISFITECLAFYTAIKFGNNLFIYNIASIIIACSLIFYFWFNVPLLRKYNLALLLGFISVLFWLIGLVFINSVDGINLFFTNYEIFLTISLAVLLIENLVHDYSRVDLKSNPHFYFALLFLLSWSSTFIQWNLYDYMTLRHIAYKAAIDLCLTMISIILNVGISLVFIFYPKMSYAKPR